MGVTLRRLCPATVKRIGKCWIAGLILIGPAFGIEVQDRYWKYQGQRVLLIGGWNHGHNPFIDHDQSDANGKSGVSTEAQVKAAMDELVDAGGNLLRCVLDPGMGAGLQGFDFCAKSNGLYDLGQMAGPYWSRLDFFLQEARKRRIIVQIEIWDRFDWSDASWESWPVSPFNPANNINYTTATSGLEHSYPNKTGNPFGQGTPGQSTYDNASPTRKRQFDRVRMYQEKFVDKLLSVTLAYDNVLYSANNEARYLEPAWGEYWIARIRNAAALRGKAVLCTDMFWDLLDLPGPSRFDHLLANAERYDYFDVSQTSAHRRSRPVPRREAGRTHWNKISYAAEQAKRANRLLHMNKIYGSKDAGLWMGTADGAVDEYWRSLIAGVAGVRFHRPTSGIGLSERSKNCLRATRKVEDKVRFWDVEPRQDLLTQASADEAYLAASPGKEYILYFTDGGSVGLDHGDYAGVRFELTWVSVATGQFGSTSAFYGGTTVTVKAPSRGPWVAAVVRTD